MPQPRSKNNLFAESERRSQLLRSSTLITRVMPLFGSNELSVFFCFRLKLASYEAFFHSPPLPSGSLAFRRIPRPHRGGHCLRQITPAGCYCGCAQSKTSAGCTKMCELPKYASRWWAVTCAKPHMTTPTEKSGAGPRLPHPGRAERASNK